MFFLIRKIGNQTCLLCFHYSSRFLEQKIYILKIVNKQACGHVGYCFLKLFFVINNKKNRKNMISSQLITILKNTKLW